MRRLLLIVVVAVVSSGLTVAALALQARGGDEADAPMLRESIEDVRDCLHEHGIERGDPEAFRDAAQECGAMLRRDVLPAFEETRDAFLADVADRLDITVEELRDALKGAALAQVDRLHEDGEISAEKAERLKERIEEGASFLLGPGPGMR